MKINIDTTSFQTKPTGAAIGGIRNRLGDRPAADVTVSDLTDCIRHGYSWTPAEMTGRTGDTWKSQQIIIADIDNDRDHVQIDTPLTIDDAIACMKDHGITPAIMYDSFSSKPDFRKFRIVLVLDRPITDVDTAVDLTARFTGILNDLRPGCADTKMADAARFVFGGRSDSIILENGDAVTSIEVLQQLPAPPQDAETAIETDFSDGGTNIPTVPVKTPTGAKYDELQQQLERDKESFNLASYIQQTTTSRPVKRGRALFFNPSPICGHNDCFQVTGAEWHDHSSNNTTGIEGGTIIDYLMAHDGIDKAAAFEKFKFEVMRYDRDEWKQAYLDTLPVKDYYTGYAETAVQATNGDGGINVPVKEENAPQATTEATAATVPDLLGQYDNVKTYMYGKMSDDIAEFKADTVRRTGFSELDNKAGGIYSGLYVVGGISSVGKTTFVWQLCEQLTQASQGAQHVLFFSLEQSRLELITKSIARRVYQGGDGMNVTSLQLRKGAKGGNIKKAAEQFIQDTGDRLNVIQCGFNTTPGYIAEYTRQYIQRYHVRPTVAIDYLQVLKPDIDPETRRKPTDNRQIVENNITALKQLSKNYNIPVIVVSSINRGNYLTSIDFESFKESGLIEFTADVVIGLQLNAVHDVEAKQKAKGTTPIGELRDIIKQAKAAPIRKIELVCLKNRYGLSNYEIQYEYMPAYDLYTEKAGSMTSNYSASDFISVDDTDDDIPDDWK